MITKLVLLACLFGDIICCHPSGYNKCEKNSECCSKVCDRSGNLKFGVCKVGTSPLVVRSLVPDDDNAIPGDSGQDVCKTTKCKTVGTLIKSTIDTSVNPCDDFYEFSCGGWKRANQIPKDKAEYSRFDEMVESLQTIMKTEMNSTSTDTDAMSVRYAMDFYKACTDSELAEKREYKPLMNLLNDFGGWPIVDNRSTFNDSVYNWKRSYVSIQAFGGRSAIFDMEVLPDANNTDINILNLGVPKFGLGRNQLVDKDKYPDIFNAYKKYILETALLLGANNNSKTIQEIDEMVEFETNLAKFSTKPEDMRESSVWYNRMTIAQLNNLTQYQHNWLKLIQGVYTQLNLTDIKLSYDDYVIVSDKPYFILVSELLSKTPKRVIANYLGWINVMKFGPFTTSKFRDTEFEFNKVRLGVQESTPIWKYCIESLENYLSFPYSRKYIDNHFDRKAKTEAMFIVKYLRKAVKLSLQENEWLDDITKFKSLEKLKSISEDIAYPDWFLDNNELDNLYNLTKSVDKKKSFESLLYMKTKSTYNMFGKLFKAVNKTLDWTTFPAKVNAYYDPTQNTITLPAGILSEPFFRSEIPANVNFGSIGHVIGHEFTHAFDDQGSEYDPKGNLVNWWTDCMKRIFKDKTKCFINKYNSIDVPEVNLTLNGKNTVGEDVSDAGGMKHAFKAYKLYEQKYGTPQLLPVVNNYSQDQLFFIAFGNILCTSIRPEALRDQIEYDPHSPNKYRVNMQVSQFKPFIDAFKCAKTSKMNDGFACELW